MSNQKTIEFQISDWNSYHEIDEEEEHKYVIQLFGRTEDDKDVCLKVTDFTPFFYVGVPDTWTYNVVEQFVTCLKKRVSWCSENNTDYHYDLSKSLISFKLVQKYKFRNFSNKKLFRFVMLIFKSHIGMKMFSNILRRPIKIYNISNDPIAFERYESNIEPFIRFMHINNLLSCGWVSLDKSKLEENRDYSYCDYSYVVHWKDVKPSNNNDRMAPFKIMSYDIECVSGDDQFPQAQRESDKIIQIGITLYRYGSLTCYEQHILTLKSCMAIKDTNVECYKTEKGLIKGFAKKITEIRPDFKTGYNIFGFDDEYISERIKRLDREAIKKKGANEKITGKSLMKEILQIMGKVKNKYLMENEGLEESLTHHQVKFLKSAAYGDNELKFIQIPGIVPIDMMKVIQREYSFQGYKLDNVSANFIKEKIKEVVETKETDDYVMIDIHTTSTKALDKRSYIQIMINDGYSPSPLSEGAKYKTLDIISIPNKKFNDQNKQEPKTLQCIKIKLNKKDIIALREHRANPIIEMFWTFAKDDMHHTKINKYFEEGDPKRIRQIAKYCIKDCKLVNLLLAKLDIIANGIGMAKVCHVPLSYLFLRGQGVKIFSLVSKKCREKNFLIPLLQKDNIDNDGDNDETYEGAMVINPKPDVYLSPIGVLDYSSLYPNSMRERNLSQECYVSDKSYDNIPGYIYHDISITLKNKKGKILKNIDGTPMKEHHRFAQEIVSDEEINRELSEVLKKITNERNININRINNEDQFTQDMKRDVVNIEKMKLEKKIEEIQLNLELLDQSGTLINNEKESYQKNIDTINKKIKLNDKYREILIKNENEKADRKMAIEKSKKCNFSQGKLVRYGILPECLAELLNKRKEINAKLAEETDPSMKPLLNGLQLAYKIVANSLYGQTGAPTSPIFFMAIAASTTAIGRERLNFAKNTVESNFEGAHVIYGDSVMGNTPIIYRDANKEINIISIENLGTNWIPYEGFKAEDSNRKSKEQSTINCEVWTTRGWSKIVRVIRHLTIKKIYRISTNSACIDVTEDHSLLDSKQNIIKPSGCNIGTQLFHGFMEPNNHDNTVSIKEAFVWGVFMNYGQSTLAQWMIKHHNLETINKIKKCLERIEDWQFVIEKKELYHLIPLDQDKYIKYKYNFLFYENAIKVVPKKILNGSVEIKRSFMAGFLDNPNWINQTMGYLKYNNTNPIAIQGIYYLLKSLKYYVIVSKLSDVKFELIYSKLKPANSDIVVRKEFIKTISYSDQYVYDLETESGTFHAGIGELIVKNTDSIFINFHVKDENGNDLTDKKALIKTMNLSIKAAKLINDNVPKPQSIVYEKSLHPFILAAKKKYVGLLFEKDPNKYIIKSMGIVLKRRDNAPIVKIVVGGIIEFILKHRNIEMAVDHTKKVIRKVMDGEYPMDKFIISKTLKAKYKNPSAHAHKVLADRMAIRDPGNKPQINDRIPFVYVITKTKKKDPLQGDLVEHPDYVIQHNLKIDYLYYLEHQIILPASQILELMMPIRKVEKLFSAYIIEETNKRFGRQSMEKWMKPSDKKLEEEVPSLFVGKKINKKPEVQSMNKWLMLSKGTGDDFEIKLTD